MDLVSSLIAGMAAGVTSGTLLSAVFGFVVKRRTTLIEAQINDSFEKALALFQANRSWREASLSQLLGPTYMQLDRSKRAFTRYQGKNIFLEAKVLGDANRTIRDLLLTRAHLIPPALLPDAALLVEHYDRWLEEFETLRSAANPSVNETFVFVGPKGYPFPAEAERRFKLAFTTMWAQTYEVDKISSIAVGRA